MAAIKEVPRNLVVDDPRVKGAHRRKDLEPLMALLGIFYGWVLAGTAAVVALLIIVFN